MFTIQFDNPHLFQVSADFLAQAQAFISGTSHTTQQTITVSDPTVARLLTHISENQPAVLPYIYDEYDEWRILAPLRQQLDRTLLHMNRFVLPSCGMYPQGRSFPVLHQSSEIDAAFPDGYYIWHSPPQYRVDILHRLGIWLNLLDNVPAKADLTPPSFREVYQQFQSALAAHNWSVAHHLLDVIRQHRLTTVRNRTFLEIELLAQQKKFERIWQNENWRALGAQSVPRRIQVALLKAFHHQELFSHEQAQDWERNCQIVAQRQAQYAQLINYRYDIIDDIVVRVFAYQAVANDAPDLLVHLLSIETLSQTTQNILNHLQQRIVPPEPTPSPQETFKRLRDQENYEAAYAAAERIDSSLLRLLAQMQCVLKLRTTALAQSVLANYEQLTTAEKQNFHKLEFGVEYYIEIIQDLAQPTSHLHTTWLDWLEALFDDPDDAVMQESLNHLKAETDKEFWTAANVEILYNYLGVMTFDLQQASPQDQSILRQSYFEQAMQALINQLMRDDQFPRDLSTFRDVYNIFYQYLRHHASTTEDNANRLLRLADNKLHHQGNPQLIGQQLLHWVSTPRFMMHLIWLDICELLIQHGISKAYLYESYQEWVSKLLDDPSPLERATLEVLRSLGEWFGDSANYLTEKIQNQLENHITESVDVISQLPSGYRILIFTLDESSGRRVKNILLDRNPDLNIQLCHEKSMTSRIDKQTQHADMHVLVTRCMSHSIYYGISSYLDDPVYPISRGSTSVIRAIEEKAEQIFQ